MFVSTLKKPQPLQQTNTKINPSLKVSLVSKKQFVDRDFISRNPKNLYVEILCLSVKVLGGGGLWKAIRS